MSLDPRRATGDRGEAAVAAWLEARGWAIEARNWRVATGELDLVATRDDLLAFVEVRSTTTDFLDSPAITVLPGKQRRVARAADAYLRVRGDSPERIRFDVAAVTFPGGEPAVTYFENAFVPGTAF